MMASRSKSQDFSMDKEHNYSGEFRRVILGFQGMWLVDTETSIFTPALNLHAQQQQQAQELHCYIATVSCIMDEMCCMTSATFALMITAWRSQCVTQLCTIVFATENCSSFPWFLSLENRRRVRNHSCCTFVKPIGTLCVIFSVNKLDLAWLSVQG